MALRFEVWVTQDAFPGAYRSGRQAVIRAIGRDAEKRSGFPGAAHLGSSQSTIGIRLAATARGQDPRLFLGRGHPALASDPNPRGTDT
jgi:hypothetical protein